MFAAAIAAGVLVVFPLPGLARQEESLSSWPSDGSASLLTQTAEEELVISQESEFNDDGFLIDEEPVAPAETADVEFYLRLSTEVFRHGDDNVEFHLPVRYAPTDRLNLEVAPFVKYQPDDDENDIDYGIRAAVEYRL